MENTSNHLPDLLTRLLANRFMRNLIAIALFCQVIDFYFDAAKAFVNGFQQGFRFNPKPLPPSK